MKTPRLPWHIDQGSSCSHQRFLGVRSVAPLCALTTRHRSSGLRDLRYSVALARLSNRRRHNKPAVVGEKRILLLGSAEERDQYLAKWRQRAVNQVCEAFQLVKQAEVSRFSERSFFYRVERGLSPAMSDDEDPDPAGDDEAAAHGFEGEVEDEVEDRTEDDGDVLIDE